MRVNHLRARACPECGAKVWRVHRHLGDRVVSLFRNVHRYRCRDVECGWEGTVPRPQSVDRARIARRSIAAAVAAALVVMAVIKLQPDGRVAGAPPAVCDVRSAPRYVPAGESYDGVELPPDELRRAEVPTGLSMRAGCAWGLPGRNPYKGSVKEALVAANLPDEVVRKIEGMVERSEVSDRVEISRAAIRTTSGKRHFDTKIVAMGFGKTLCFGTHVNFQPGHLEFADLYDAKDATGTSYAVMIPYVCGNVSVLAERAERPDAVAAGRGGSSSPEGGSLGTGRPRAGIGTGSSGLWVSPGAGRPRTGGDEKLCAPDVRDAGSDVRSVPEPGTIAVVFVALAAMAVGKRTSRRRRSEERADR
jgi:hypothetical protein